MQEGNEELLNEAKGKKKKGKKSKKLLETKQEGTTEMQKEKIKKNK